MDRIAAKLLFVKIRGFWRGHLQNAERLKDFLIESILQKAHAQEKI